MFFLPGVSTAISGVAFTAGFVAILGTITAAFWYYWKRIPSPTEFWPINWIFYNLGLHTHKEFDLIVDFHEANFVPSGANIYFHIEAGRFDAGSQISKVPHKETKQEIYERVPIHVRQCDNILKIQCYRKVPLRSDLIGNVDVDVVKEILDRNFPKTVQLALCNKHGQVGVRVEVSFFKGTPLSQGAFMEQQALLILEQTGKHLDIETFRQLPREKQLFWQSQVLRGPLNMMSSWGHMTPTYWQALKDRNDNWLWCGWEDLEEMQKHSKPAHILPVLNMLMVVRNEDSRHDFSIRVATDVGKKDYYFRRVERDRDIWVNAIYNFVLIVREGAEKLPKGSSVPKPPSAFSSSIENPTTAAGGESHRMSFVSKGYADGDARDMLKHINVPRHLQVLREELDDANHSQTEDDDPQETTPLLSTWFHLPPVPSLCGGECNTR